MLLLLLTYKNPYHRWPTRVCCHTLTPDWLPSALKNSTVGNWAPLNTHLQNISSGTIARSISLLSTQIGTGAIQPENLLFSPTQWPLFHPHPLSKAWAAPSSMLDFGGAVKARPHQKRVRVRVSFGISQNRTTSRSRSPSRQCRSSVVTTIEWVRCKSIASRLLAANANALGVAGPLGFGQPPFYVKSAGAPLRPAIPYICRKEAGWINIRLCIRTDSPWKSVNCAATACITIQCESPNSVNHLLCESPSVWITFCVNHWPYNVNHLLFESYNVNHVLCESSSV